jgi:hypothetical protein
MSLYKGTTKKNDPRSRMVLEPRTKEMMMNAEDIH